MAIESVVHRSCTSESLKEPAPIAFAVVDVTHLIATSCELYSHLKATIGSASVARRAGM